MTDDPMTECLATGPHGDDPYHNTPWPCPLCLPECYEGRSLKPEFDPYADRDIGNWP